MIGWKRAFKSWGNFIREKRHICLLYRETLANKRSAQVGSAKKRSSRIIDSHMHLKNKCFCLANRRSCYRERKLGK